MANSKSSTPNGRAAKIPSPPRTILYTGKGGVGKTSVAAATARRCAAKGLKTVVLSTDPAHSLSDSLQTDLTGQPTEVAPNLFGQEVQAGAEMERHWSAVQDWLGGMLADQGVDQISAEELSVPPGMDELFSLLQIKEHYESGEFEVIIVDCAPTGETLRLLSFPDVARWWLEKVFPWEKRIMSAARPLARTLLDIQLPSKAVYDEVEQLVTNLIAMNGILRNHETTSIRLVMNADKIVAEEAMRTFTYLNLYGYLTDGVIVNRLFPKEVDDTYFGAWRAMQQDMLSDIKSGFSPVPVLTARYFDQEVVGGKMLDRLGVELFGKSDAAAVMHDRIVQELIVENGHAELFFDLPFASKEDIQLKKIGLQVVVRVGDQKRTVILPPALATYKPRQAEFEDGGLRVRFESQKVLANEQSN